MSNFSGPAGKRADTQLFGRVAPGLTRLQKQSRGELRNVARANFWAQKTAADQASAQAQQQATGPQTGADSPA
jgi:hypothetical protein